MKENIVKPVYQKIAIDIASRIADGEFLVGEKIHGRSTLAGKYNVSPETIRRAVFLLQDTKIVSVSQGSGIVVESAEKARAFISRFQNVDSIAAIREDLSRILKEKERLDLELRASFETLLDYTVRFKPSTPFTPMEFTIPAGSTLIGKTVGETHFWQHTGATVIAVRRKGEVILSPGPYITFNEHDVFVLIGDADAYSRVSSFIHHSE